MKDDPASITGRLAGEGPAAKAQLALLDGLDPKRRAMVVERLGVLDAFLRSDRSAADARKAAEQLTMGVRNLYRLIARMEEVGPVAGLIPGHRGLQRPDAAEDGPDPTIDRWLRVFVKSSVSTSRSRAEGYVQGRIDALAEANPDLPRKEMPSPIALAARLDALKKEGASAVGCTIGERILVDQVVLAPTVSNVGGRRERVAATFVIDRATSLILGAGISVVPDTFGDGIGSAIANLSKRVIGLTDAGISATSAREIEWVVPPGLVEHVGTALKGLSSAGSGTSPGGIRLIVVDEGDRRHAVQTVALLGSSLGRLRFLTRAKMDVRHADDASAADVEDTGERIETVHEALLSAVDRWNAARVRRLAPEDPATSTDGGDALVQALRSVFDPVVAAATPRPERGRPS